MPGGRPHLDDRERRTRLTTRHGLGRDGASVPEVADRLVALHSSDPVTVYLSLAARIDGFAVADGERALYEDRTVVRMLGMRRTLWVVTPELVGAVQASSTDKVAAAERRRAEQLVAANGHADDPGPWLEALGARLLAEIRDRGEVTTRELPDLVPELGLQVELAPGKPYNASASIASRLLPVLAAEGHLVRTRPLGSWVASQYRWTSTARWLGDEPARPERADAQAEVARRWLGAFGPGTAEDLRWWTGWTKGHARAALDAVGAVEVDLDGGATGWVLPDDVERSTAVEPVAALLPSLDPTTMGWKERAWYLGDHAERLFDRNGNAGPTIWWDGRVVGGWAQRDDGTVATELLDDVGTEGRDAIEVAAGRLEAWLGDTRVRTRFPTPLERDLRA